MTKHVNIPAYLHDSVNRRILMPLFALAAESCCNMPLLTDRKALEISEVIRKISGCDIHLKRDILHYTYVLRTLCFDRLINDFLWRHPAGTVVNIGCGFDTTFERLDYSGAQWYDIDLPEVIGLRKLFFDETEKRKFISSSFLKKDWINEIVFNDSVLIFACGVYYYYDENIIKKFFSGLISSFPSSELLFNVTSAAGVRAANRLMRNAGFEQGPFLKWGVSDYNTITAWNDRLKLIGDYRIFSPISFNSGVPFKLIIQGMISDALAIERVLHIKTRYNFLKLAKDFSQR